MYMEITFSVSSQAHTAVVELRVHCNLYSVDIQTLSSKILDDDNVTK